MAEARSKSNADKKYKSVAIMDVNAEAVDALMRSNNYAVMIHGHTHRPAVHEWTLDDNACERWVLPDWSGEEGGFMRTDSSGGNLKRSKPNSIKTCFSSGFFIGGRLITPNHDCK